MRDAAETKRQKYAVDNEQRVAVFEDITVFTDSGKINRCRRRQSCLNCILDARDPCARDCQCQRRQRDVNRRPGARHPCRRGRHPRRRRPRLHNRSHGPPRQRHAKRRVRDLAQPTSHQWQSSTTHADGTPSEEAQKMAWMAETRKENARQSSNKVSA